MPDGSPADERAKVVEAIEAAFADVALGEGITLHEARALDDYEAGEALRAARAIDCDWRWQDIPDDTLRTLNNVHNFLDDAGYRYYMPAYLLWVLRHLDDETDHHRSLNERTISSLDPGGDASRHRRMATFDAAQRRAVCLFLRHLARVSTNDRGAAEWALLTYWGRFCDATQDDDENENDYRRARLGQ